MSQQGLRNIFILVDRKISEKGEEDLFMIKF